MKALLLVFILFCATGAFSQTATFIVKAGVNPASVLPVNYRYLNNEYQEGYLLLPTGKKSNAKFNYDLLYRSLIFITESNDTLFINPDASIKSLHMGKDDFYRDAQKGYFKILATDTLSTLASQVRLEEVRHAMQGSDGFGGTESTGSSFSIRTGGGSTDNTRSYDVTYQRVTEHFLIDQQGEITKANKTGFLEMFPGLAKSLKTYFKNENVDFNKEEDLLKLFKYCLSFMEGN